MSLRPNINGRLAIKDSGGPNAQHAITIIAKIIEIKYCWLQILSTITLMTRL